MDSDRGRDTEGQGHRRTGTQIDRDRDIDKQGQGHKGTGKGTQTDMDRDTETDIENVNGHLTKNKSVESVKFSKIL